MQASILLLFILTAASLAEKGKDSRLLDSGIYDYRFIRSYWLLCRHVIYVYSYLGLINEPN
jgi:hypothetical protein